MAAEKRLIYAEDAKKAMECVAPVSVYRIDNVPTADAVEVVHARWIPTECGTMCSACHRVYDNDFEIRRSVCRELKRCPNCGAKMDKDNLPSGDE